MGNIFNRHPKKKPSTVSSPKRSTKHQTTRNMDNLLLDNDTFIQDLTECGEFLARLDVMLSNPDDVEHHSLDFDPETLKSYIQALNLKADQLRKIKLLLAKHPNIPNAVLLAELMTQVEPKFNEMSQRLASEKNFLAVAGQGEGHQNKSAAQDQPSNDQPGVSGAGVSSLPSTSGTNVRGNTTQNTITGGNTQTGMTRGNRARTSFRVSVRAAAGAAQPISSPNQQRNTVPSTSRPHMQPLSVEESRGFSLIFSQSDVSSSSTSVSDEEDSSAEVSQYMRCRSADCSEVLNFRLIEDWRKENMNLKPKRIFLNRSENILDSVMPLYSKMTSNTLRRIASVKFSEEEGTDMGGLTREFFFLVFEAVTSGTYKGQKVMVGNRGHLIPNSMADCRLFFYLGQMIVHAVINCSKGLCGLSPAIVQYLASGTNAARLEDSHPPVSVEDVDDSQLKQLLEKYEKGENFTDSEDESWLNWMTESNCSVNWRKSETRSYVIQHLLIHFVFWKRLRQIQSLEEGLKSVGLLQFLISNPTDVNISEVLPSGKNLAYTADAVIQILITRGVDFEIETWNFFLQFLKDLYNDDIDNFHLPDLIQFVTSSPYFPERIVVSFKKDIALPEAHACYNEIALPNAHDTYPKFKGAMVRALENGLTGFQLE